MHSLMVASRLPIFNHSDLAGYFWKCLIVAIVIFYGDEGHPPNFLIIEETKSINIFLRIQIYIFTCWKWKIRRHDFIYSFTSRSVVKFEQLNYKKKGSKTIKANLIWSKRQYDFSRRIIFNFSSSSPPFVWLQFYTVRLCVLKILHSFLCFEAFALQCLLIQNKNC